MEPTEISSKIESIRTDLDHFREQSAHLASLLPRLTAIREVELCELERMEALGKEEDLQPHAGYLEGLAEKGKHRLTFFQEIGQLSNSAQQTYRRIVDQFNELRDLVKDLEAPEECAWKVVNLGNEIARALTECCDNLERGDQ